LWTSSCSAKCEAAALTIAAKWGEVVRREISTSARPEAGPMVRA
jgi:hypothetical protein